MTNGSEIFQILRTIVPAGTVKIVTLAGQAGNEYKEIELNSNQIEVLHRVTPHIEAEVKEHPQEQWFYRGYPSVGDATRSLEQHPERCTHLGPVLISSPVTFPGVAVILVYHECRQTAN